MGDRRPIASAGPSPPLVPSYLGGAVEGWVGRSFPLQDAHGIRTARTEQPENPDEAVPMSLAGWFVLVSDAIPLGIALNANRTTSLIHSTCWSVAAWLSWVVAFLSNSMATVPVALAMTACAGVAVLGARRPGSVAWNFVVGGLLVVLTLPLAEAEAAGSAFRPSPMHTVFLACLLGTIVINYLPTRLGGGAALLAFGCGLAMRRIGDGELAHECIAWCIGLAPWVAWLGLVLRPSARNGDDTWRRFRDRYGAIWSLRLREQFNRAAVNAGLAVELRWTGLHGEASPAARELLTQTTKRFSG
jgi:hypothetical protein